MIALIAILIFFGIIGSTWWFGLWNNILNLINFFIAAMVASAYYENFAAVLYGSLETYDYLLDFVALWLIFFLVFGFLRLITEIVSPVRLKFHPAVDIAGRSIVCIWLAIAFLLFASFSLHLAPIPPSDEDLAGFDSGQTVEQYIDGTENPGTTFLGFGPGRMWMAFIQSRSRGALSAAQDEPLLGEYNLAQHPDDADANCRVFDPFSRMPVKRQFVRNLLSAYEGLRVEGVPGRSQADELRDRLNGN